MAKISNHYKKDRQYRDYLIRKKIGYGKAIQETTEKSGRILVLSDTGIITVYNRTKTILITRIIANPNYIKGYFPNAPQCVLEKAKDNQKER